MFAAEQHAVTHGAFGAGLTAIRLFIQVVTVVADAGGIVGVCAGRLHAVQAGAHRAGLTFLCVAEVFREGFTWIKKAENNNLLGLFLIVFFPFQSMYILVRSTPFITKGENDLCMATDILILGVSTASFLFSDNSMQHC